MLFGRVRTNGNHSSMRAKMAMATTAIAIISSIELTAPANAGLLTVKPASSLVLSQTGNKGQTLLVGHVPYARFLRLPAGGGLAPRTGLIQRN